MPSLLSVVEGTEQLIKSLIEHLTINRAAYFLIGNH
jgi:hypothetical protein